MEEWGYNSYVNQPERSAVFRISGLSLDGPAPTLRVFRNGSVVSTRTAFSSGGYWFAQAVFYVTCEERHEVTYSITDNATDCGVYPTHTLSC